MSAVTAAILIGSTPRVGAGIIPRWVVLLHEGSSYAWHMLRLQLSVGELGDHSRDDPPGVLWRASANEDIAGELALMLHMYAARTPEIVTLTRRIRHLQRRRVDLSGLQGVELAAFENALRVARSRGRELRLTAQILPGSRLTDEHLLSLPDWELEVCYSAFSRDWTHADGGRLVIREHQADDSTGPIDLTALGDDDHDDEFLDDSDTHAVADHPGNLVTSDVAGAADAAGDGSLESALEDQSENAAAVTESLTAGAVSSRSVTRHEADGFAPHDHTSATSSVHAPGAASAWLEREPEPDEDSPGKGLFGRLRFNR